MFDEQVIRLAEVGQVLIFLDRQHEMATLDLGTRMQARNCLRQTVVTRKLEKRLGHLSSGCSGAVVVRRARRRSHLRFL